MIAIHRVRMKPKPKIRVGRLKYSPGAPKKRLGHVRVERGSKPVPDTEGKQWPRE